MDAQGALDSLLGRLTSILVDEAQLLGCVRNDVEFIKDEIECMNSFVLQLTEAQHRNHQVRTWMKQVVSFTNDCGGNVELYIYYVGGTTAGKGLFRSLWGVPWFLRTIPVRHRIATRIKELKFMVQDVGERQQRYGLTVLDALPDQPRAIIDKPILQSGGQAEEDLRRRQLLYGDAEIFINRYNSSGSAAGSTLMSTGHWGQEVPKLWHNYVFSVHEQENRTWFFRRRALALANCSVDSIDSVLTECYADAFALQMFLHLLYVKPNRSARELSSLCGFLQQNKNNIAKTMLMFCYNDLPINYKSCLLYVSIFPHDRIIRRTRLLMRWIAEGLVAERTATAREKDKIRHRIWSLEDQAERIFNALVARGFVHPVEISISGKIKSYTVHHIVHEFITTDLSLVDTCLPSHLAHHLSINNGIALHEASSSNQPFDVTQTLLEYMPQLPRWQLLKVLDLEGCTGFKKKHLKNICKVLLLKYLSLRNTDVTELPNQIEKLQCLEILDIRHTAMRAFSTKSVRLPMLKYFLAGNTIYQNNTTTDRFPGSFATVRLPSGIRRMKKLEVMSHVEVSSNVYDLIDIGQLLQLRKLGVVLHGTKSVLGILFQQIEKLHGSLRSLSIRMINQQIRNESSPDDKAMPSLANPPKLLESLNISGITSGLPSWIAGLDQLSKVTLQDTCLGKDDIHILGKLKMLRCLRLLHKSYTESKLRFKVDEFQRLRFLVIEGTDIINVTFDAGEAPKLEMIVWSFFTLEAISGVSHLPKLKKLELNGDCNLDPVKAEIEKHPNHPELKRNPHSQHQEDRTVVGASSSQAP